MFSAEATNPAVSIRAVSAIRIPAGLIRKSWPLERSVPAIVESCPPVTRLSTLEAAGFPVWKWNAAVSEGVMLNWGKLKIAWSDSMWKCCESPDTSDVTDPCSTA